MNNPKCNKCNQPAYKLLWSAKKTWLPYCKKHFKERKQKRELSKIKQMKKRQALENEMKY